MIPQTFSVTSEHTRFYFLVFFSVLHFLVVVSVLQIKLSHVGFRAHVKIASRIVSYRCSICSSRVARCRSHAVHNINYCVSELNTTLNTRSTQPCIPPGSLNRLLSSAGGNGGIVSSAGWKATPCDSTRHVSSRSIEGWLHFPCEQL